MASVVSASSFSRTADWRGANAPGPIHVVAVPGRLPRAEPDQFSGDQQLDAAIERGCINRVTGHRHREGRIRVYVLYAKSGASLRSRSG